MTEAILTEECPTCRGEREMPTGRAGHGGFEMRPCGTCGGMGRVAPDDPSLTWADCPHCTVRIRIEAAIDGAPDAFDCPECGGFYHVPYTDNEPHALDVDQVEF